MGRELRAQANFAIFARGCIIYKYYTLKKGALNVPDGFHINFLCIIIIITSSGGCVGNTPYLVR